MRSARWSEKIFSRVFTFHLYNLRYHIMNKCEYLSYVIYHYDLFSNNESKVDTTLWNLRIIQYLQTFTFDSQPYRFFRPTRNAFKNFPWQDISGPKKHEFRKREKNRAIISKIENSMVKNYITLSFPFNLNCRPCYCISYNVSLSQKNVLICFILHIYYLANV